MIFEAYMKKSERAASTRANLVLSAARRFDRYGYDGTTLSSVCVEANVTLGALTFHFRCKASLAFEVVQKGVDELRHIGTARPTAAGALTELSFLVLQMVTALQGNVLTRAAVRLIQEGHVASDWFDAFHEEVSRLLERATAAGDLVAGVRPTVAVRLVMYVVEGAMADARRAGAGGVPTGPDFAEVWSAVLEGLDAHTG
ncbi:MULTISPECIES: TetR family transcriptional regulator [unclassified Streptomyces]|uniref:TetR family transcriptional regulator n=2 Tax=unclassified Streptomyces TaxID=2593676 RepID=UPI0036964BAC